MHLCVSSIHWVLIQYSHTSITLHRRKRNESWPLSYYKDLLEVVLYKTRLVGPLHIVPLTLHISFLKMYEGKEMRSDLIKELHTTHALQSPEQKQKKKETEAILSKQRAKEKAEHKVNTIKLTINNTNNRNLLLMMELNKELPSWLVNSWTSSIKNLSDYRSVRYTSTHNYMYCCGYV